MKRKNKFYILFIIITYLFFPLFFDKFIMNKFHTFFEKSDWASFLGGYIGSGITLIGIAIQIFYDKKSRQEEKEEEKRKTVIETLEHLNFVIQKNLSENNKNWFYIVHSYTISNWWIRGYENEALIEFEQTSLIQNSKLIHNLSFYNDIFEVNKEIIKFNKTYLFLKENLSKKRAFLENLEEKIKKIKIEDLPIESHYIFKEFLNLVTFFSKISMPLFNLIKDEGCSYYKEKTLNSFNLIKFSTPRINKSDLEFIFNEKENLNKRIQKLVNLINIVAHTVFFDLSSKPILNEFLNIDFNNFEIFTKFDNDFIHLNIDKLLNDLSELHIKILLELDNNTKI